MFRLISLLLLLAACATPREQCLQNATREIAVIDALIAETEANVTRGYAIRRDVEPTVRLDFCASPNAHFQFCNRRTTRIVERPEAIDRNEERRKLASLQQRRRELEQQARREIAACDAQFPTSG